MAANREHAHQLIDQLPEAQLSGLVGFLETIVDPALAALHKAEAEDEEIGEEEEQAVDKARAWLRDNGGRGIPHDEAMRRLGL